MVFQQGAFFSESCMKNWIRRSLIKYRVGTYVDIN